MGAKVSVTSSDLSISKLKEEEMPYAHSAKEFTKLKTVSITKGALRLFPKQLGLDLHTYPSMIDTLVDLDLSFNNLEKLPDEICLLVQLRKFRAEQNHINRLPDGFPALCKLEKCYLNDNDLHELPVDMANMVNLRVLRLHNNRLFWIPNDIGKLPLEELTIHENPLKNEILELPELDDVLEYFRRQQAPMPYLKALKAHLMESKIKDGLHELKEGRLHAFRVMLASEDARAFEKYLEKEFAIENLRFYRDADEFRNKFPSNFPLVCKELRDAGLVLYKKYIETGEHINIPISIKKKIDEAFLPDSPNPPDQWVFADAYVSICKLMFEDTFKRFLETTDGKKAWAIYEHHATKAGKKDKEKEKASKKATASPSGNSSPAPHKRGIRIDITDSDITD